MLTHDDADNGPRPWDRRQGESAAAWAAFAAYRDAGPVRSLEKTGAKLGRTRNAVGLHSARWNWTERTAAYDAWLDRQGQAKAVDATRDARARQARHALALQLVAMERFESMDPLTMTVSEAIRAWQVGAQEERRALGIPDAASVDHTGAGLPLGFVPVTEVIIERPAVDDGPEPAP
ncbi:MAG: hypothetical protein IPJ58_12200 [Ardenticatenia bacterium]|nr:hypothetical protein [Ardenticatenia bacterium]